MLSSCTGWERRRRWLGSVPCCESECGPIEFSVSRIDLFADFQGWTLSGNERHRFVKRSDLVITYEEADVLTGLQFGRRTSGTVTCRIYDKSAEASRSGAGYWPQVWGDRYDRNRPVLRVEFEILRGALRQYGLDTPERVLAAAGDMWLNLTSEWLSFRVSTEDRTRSRWPIAAEWEAVRRASLADNSYGVDRIYAGKRSGELEKLLPALVGYLSSTAALTSAQDLEEVLPLVGELVRSHESRSGVRFESRIADKVRQYRLP